MPTNPGHYLRPFGFGEDVAGHRKFHLLTPKFAATILAVKLDQLLPICLNSFDQIVQYEA